MALFKIYRGLEANLPTEMHDGYAYFCSDSAAFFIDFLDYDGNLQRKQLNAKDAETLSGASLATILQSSEVEIPTSKAVFDALKSKQNKLTFDETPTADSTNPVTSGGVYAARSDWNQNDETAPDYVKNRPFYTSDPVETVIVPEETVTIDSDDGGSEKMSASMILWHDNYIVYFNGIRYECAASFSGSGSFVSPNDAREPFYITGNHYRELWIHTTTAGTYTVSLAVMQPEDIKIPDKYIPDTIARTADLDTHNAATDAHADLFAEKQDKLVGAQGQVVGFDSDGNAVAEDKPTSMPEVTTSDNGKFLRVIDGAWAAATVPNAEEVSF